MNPYLTKNKFIKGFFLDQAVTDIFSTETTLEYYKKYEITLTEVAENLSLIGNKSPFLRHWLKKPP